MDTDTAIFYNLGLDQLVQAALDRGEAAQASNGALSVTTGKRTGRSPKDRYIVRDTMTTDTIDWGDVNQPIDQNTFQTLWNRASHYLESVERFVGHYRVGQESNHGVYVEVETEYAWHQLFVKNLFIDDGLYHSESAWKIMSAPNLTLNPAEDGVSGDGAVILNFSERRVLLIGMKYAGEMKKSMFTVLNFMLPQKDILPMHCAANAKEDGSNLALFFGLSGTGKTTLSADPDRFLIGDDEHGWSQDGVFNFEGGCYAKCIDLDIEREPVIWQAIRSGSIMENVVLDKTGTPDFTDASLTQNTRAAYPLSHINQRVLKNAGNTPDAVIFLTCDLYGVLPPVASLTPTQAAYYFLSGYTALVGSTEVGGSTGIKPTFSTCFGAPFFPRAAHVYADLLMKRVQETNCPVYLVNTGWQGGSYGNGGERFAIPTTRAVITAIVDGTITLGETMPGFGFRLAESVPGVDTQLLDPINGWDDQSLFTQKCNELIDQFQKNFTRFAVADEILNSAPQRLE